MHSSPQSRREVQRQRRRRKENVRFAQILKVFRYFQKTGRWLHHTQLEWLTQGIVARTASVSLSVIVTAEKGLCRR
jgi:hypothetical protein